MLIEIIRNSILITGLVVIMMMMIESLNIESHGLIFSGLKRTRVGQVVVSALLGLVPGCIGGFAAVSLYTHRIISFGALIAMMIASSGDEAFVMIAMIPDQAMTIFLLLFAIAVVTGLAVDVIKDRFQKKGREIPATDRRLAEDRFEIHEHHGGTDGEAKERHITWKRAVLFLGVLVFITALVTGKLGHDHSTDVHHDHGHQEEICIHDHSHQHDGLTINLLSEDWMYVLFAGLSIIVLGVLCFASDSFIGHNLWDHIVKRHLPTIFLWTFGILTILGFGLRYIDIGNWISDNTALMILLAVAVGIIPESGPHMIFVTLYVSGIVPFPVLLASCISQDGHSSLPLLAESKISFIWAKVINCIIALAAGFGAMLLI